MPKKLEHDNFLEIEFEGYESEKSEIDSSMPLFSEGLDLQGQIEAIIFASEQ